MLRDLTELGIWSDDIKNKIIFNNGSIQAVDCIPDNIKKLSYLRTKPAAKAIQFTEDVVARKADKVC